MVILEIEPVAIPLTTLCKGLNAVGCNRDFERASMRPVMACQRLEVLRTNVNFRSLGNHAETLIPLVSLRHLEIVVEFPDEIEFLQEDEFAVDLPLPSLKAIILKHLHRSDRASSLIFFRVYSHILRTRANLKAFSVEGEDINPLCVFLEPGLEGSNTEWACHNLECLCLSLSWPELCINTQRRHADTGPLYSNK
ncbi:hypothetical protein BGX26_001488 [Mortierella sp. AD094]|nr:hypothetical protein BGX26_001488 [Mortierella sp. AD094]